MEAVLTPSFGREAGSRGDGVNSSISSPSSSSSSCGILLAVDEVEEDEDDNEDDDEDGEGEGGGGRVCVGGEEGKEVEGFCAVGGGDELISCIVAIDDDDDTDDDELEVKEKLKEEKVNGSVEELEATKFDDGNDNSEVDDEELKEE